MNAITETANPVALPAEIAANTQAVTAPNDASRLLDQVNAIEITSAQDADVASAKISGATSRATWKAEIVDQRAYLQWLLDSSMQDFSDWISFSPAVLNQRAREFKSALNIPGVRAVEVHGLSVR
jgi:hypothetical protein